MYYIFIKPKNPYCGICPFKDSCIAFNKNVIHELPVKTKSAKAKKKYFNFLVFISEDEKTILEKREGKGIWQNLYQFPLIETEKNISEKGFKSLVENDDLLKDIPFELSLYNKDPIIHKLSHQHLYTKFWVVNVEKLAVEGASINKVREFAVPILIGNFIESFNF